jgi:hypothetical protein
MDWNNNRPEDRIHLWKSFRKSIEEKSSVDQLSEIATFFSSMPIGSRTMDFYSPATWPTPWEMLYQEQWCASSTSLLIFYTLGLLPNFRDSKTELFLVDDGKDRYLLPVINDQFVLNYILGQVSNLQDINDDFRIMEIHSKQTIKKIK